DAGPRGAVLRECHGAHRAPHGCGARRPSVAPLSRRARGGQPRLGPHARRGERMRDEGREAAAAASRPHAPAGPPGVSLRRRACGGGSLDAAAAAAAAALAGSGGGSPEPPPGVGEGGAAGVPAGGEASPRRAEA
ncbi:unnamed protein product, partial [Prorocentrum cordatum]